MIIISLIYIAQGNGTNVSNLKMFDLGGLPSLFGAAVYSFMCHHSLPSIVSPIKDKRRVTTIFGADYVSIYVAYITLCVSAQFAFGSDTEESCSNHPGAPCKLQQLYNLNFSSYNMRWISEYLLLFPVFTLTSNFPLIAITLRNNIETLFSTMFPDSVREIGEATTWALWFRKHMFSFFAIVPPLAVAFFTHDIDYLVGVTGSFAGCVIQYIIPCTLVYYARRHPKLAAAYPKHGYARVANSDEGLLEEHESSVLNGTASSDSASEYGAVPGPKTVINAMTPNIHVSPFRSIVWVYVMIAWSAITLGMSFYNQVHKIAKK